MMNKRAIYLVALLALAFVVSGCGIFQKKLPIITLTMADNNKTHTFAKGQKVQLELVTGYEWSILVPEPYIFKQVIDAHTLPGIQGVYLANRVGSTQLEARGEAICKLEGTFCDKEDVEFKITVIVVEN